ncbi:MAG: cytochrome P450 [Piptocephalis tieghemiana]|nr:MAG: cytochrome P450 [Piptocephalis tieghemiana]
MNSQLMASLPSYLIKYVPAALLTLAAIPIGLPLIYLTFCDLHNRWILRRMKSVPGCKSIPLFGSFFEFARVRFQEGDGFSNLIRIYGRGKGMVKLSQLNQVNLLVSDPEVSRQILVDDFNFFDKGSVFETLGGFVGHLSLPVVKHSNNGPWKRQRRITEPAFKSSAIRQLQPMIQRVSDTFTEELLAKDGQLVDVKHFWERFTLSIINEAIGAGHAPKEFVDSMVEIATYLFSPLYLIPFIGVKLHCRRHQKALDTVDSFIFKNCAERRALIEAGEKTPNDFLDILIREAIQAEKEGGNAMTSQELRDQLLMFYVAGFETTSNALAFVTHHVSTDPTILKKLHAEVDSVRPSELESGSIAQTLPYSLMCFNEALRLHPPSIFSVREAQKDIRLTGSNVVVPAGVAVYTVYYSIQRDTKLWGANANDYYPDRFAEELPHKWAFSPFSGGPRVCVGKQLVIAEALTVMRSVFSRIKFTPAPDSMPVAEDLTSGLLKIKKLNCYVSKR